MQITEGDARILNLGLDKRNFKNQVSFQREYKDHKEGTVLLGCKGSRVDRIQREKKMKSDF